MQSIVHLTSHTKLRLNQQRLSWYAEKLISYIKKVPPFKGTLSWITEAGDTVVLKDITKKNGVREILVVTIVSLSKKIFNQKHSPSKQKRKLLPR